MNEKRRKKHGDLSFGKIQGQNDQRQAAYLGTELINARIGSDLIGVVLSGQATEDDFAKKNIPSQSRILNDSYNDD